MITDDEGTLSRVINEPLPIPYLTEEEERIWRAINEPKQHVPLSKDEMARAIKRLRQTMSVKAIAVALNCSESTIRRYLKVPT